MKTTASLTREFRVRFAHIDGARVIFYPRYIEMVCDTFPEAPFPVSPFDLKIRFSKSNRLGDIVCMELTPTPGGWTVRGLMPDEHFSIAMSRTDEPAPAISSLSGCFETDPSTIAPWMCGPDGRLQLSRYFELVSLAVEQWFETALELPFRELHVVREYGIPTVQLCTRVSYCPSVGDTVSFRLRLETLGNSSLTLTWWLIGANDVWIETRQTLVFVELDDKRIRPAPFPSALRSRLAEALAASGHE